MMGMRESLHEMPSMLLFRGKALLTMVLTIALYRWRPCRLTMLVRLVAQIALLGEWYPDTYEFNRCFGNLDHVFCAMEQAVFGCQPSIDFSRVLPWGIISEPLDMGYASYYPIIIFTVLFYFFYRPAQLQRTAFTLMSAFFLFYIIFIFVPVAGPTFYFRAVGLDEIEQIARSTAWGAWADFPNIGNYFETHSDLADDCLPSPGWTKGLMWQIVEIAKWAGERPTAAFPSSHVGVTTVCMLLLWQTKNRRVFFITLPFAVLMFFATFYIQAHYAIDAVAGIAFGVAFTAFLQALYRRVWGECPARRERLPPHDH